MKIRNTFNRWVGEIMYIMYIALLASVLVFFLGNKNKKALPLIICLAISIVVDTFLGEQKGTMFFMIHMACSIGIGIGGIWLLFDLFDSHSKTDEDEEMEHSSK